MKKALAMLLLTLIASSHASIYTRKVSSISVSQTASDDPYESFNRTMFRLNEYLDKHMLKPVATVYSKIMPHPLQHGVRNMYNNLSDLPTIGNDVLQGNFYQATSDTWRFCVNSTAGLAGFYDVSSRIGLEANHEDFGLTLAQWGWHHSDYLVLPLFGPSTTRDVLGMPVDLYAFSIYSRIDDMKLRNGLYVLGAISQRAELLQYQDVYNQIAIDQYAFVKNAYLQQRAAEIQRNTELSDPYYETAHLDHTQSDKSDNLDAEAAFSQQGSTVINPENDIDAEFAAQAFVN
jgi:phospholipid-binding lipoprotein MlaA